MSVYKFSIAFATSFDLKYKSKIFPADNDVESNELLVENKRVFSKGVFLKNDKYTNFVYIYLFELEVITIFNKFKKFQICFLCFFIFEKMLLLLQHPLL